MHDLLAQFRRSRLIRAIVGPDARPPIGILWSFQLRVDNTVAEYTSVVDRQPLFELRRRRDVRIGT